MGWRRWGRSHVLQSVASERDIMWSAVSLPHQIAALL